MPNRQTYYAVGLMSGSSLDGLDIAYCKLTNKNEQWHYNIIHTKCLNYSKEILNELKQAQNLSGKALFQLHFNYGHYLGEQVKQFIQKKGIKQVDLVASHGHTVFHEPNTKMSVQIGHGATLANACNLTTITDLRTTDIAFGGQGAPIVPIADWYLFSDYNACLNLGGIANISLKQNNTITAWDICTANQILNHYAKKLGHPYDDQGAIAKQGTINQALLNQLNQLAYYKQNPPKSLANQFSNRLISIIDSYSISSENKLSTYTEHIATQIASSLFPRKEKTNMLITGGGAFNTHLINRIKHHAPFVEFVIPSAEIINYKEALAMAFIGVLRFKNQPNVLSQVTGAEKNTINGCIYQP